MWRRDRSLEYLTTPIIGDDAGEVDEGARIRAVRWLIRGRWSSYTTLEDVAESPDA